MTSANQQPAPSTPCAATPHQQEVSQWVISKLSTWCEQYQQVVVVNAGTTLAELELDSLALMEIVFELEDEWGISMDPGTLQALDTVGDLVAAIQRQRKPAN